MPLFSVIVPAHNSSAYIEVGLQSIVNQSFTDYELIIVCDSCTDNTADIARKYTDKVYEVSFGQDGQTRNVGLDHASGEWVLFMDDDDWFLHEFVFQQLAEAVGKHNEDVLAFSFIWRTVGYQRNYLSGLCVVVWSKCWKRSFIGDTRFSSVPRTSNVDFHNAMMAKNQSLYPGICLCIITTICAKGARTNVGRQVKSIETHPYNRPGSAGAEDF